MSPTAGKPGQRFPMPAQIAAVVVGLLVVAAAAYFLLVVPKKSEFKSAKAHALDLEQQVSAGTTAAQTASAQSKIKVADAFRLTKAMPDSADVGAIILELNALADQAGIRFDSIHPNTPTQLSGYSVLPVEVIFQGSFWELSDFLGRLRSLVLVHKQQLEASGRLFTVDKLSFTQGDTGFPKISATLTIDAYVYGGNPPTSGSPGHPSTTSTTGTGTTATTTGSTNINNVS